MRITSRPDASRARLLAVLLACVAFAAFVCNVQRKSHAAAPPANCAAPGLQVVSDPANDQLGNQAAQNQQQDILGVSFAEEYDSFGRGMLVVTMKVSALDPNGLPRNGEWLTYFNATAPDNTTTTYFVSADTNESAQIAYNYGFIDPTTGSNTTNASADSGSVSAASKTVTRDRHAAASGSSRISSTSRPRD